MFSFPSKAPIIFDNSTVFWKGLGFFFEAKKGLQPSQSLLFTDPTCGHSSFSLPPSLQASKQAAAPLEHAYQQQQHVNSSSPDDLSGSSTTTPSACLPNQKEWGAPISSRRGMRAAERMELSSCPWQRRPPWRADLAYFTLVALASSSPMPSSPSPMPSSPEIIKNLITSVREGKDGIRGAYLELEVSSSRRAAWGSESQCRGKRRRLGESEYLLDVGLREVEDEVTGAQNGDGRGRR